MMSRDGLRVLTLAGISIALIVASTLVMDWFVATIAGDSIGVMKITFDLREARLCSELGPCGVVPMSMIKGTFYPTLAAVTFWGSLVFGLLVLYQAGSRVLGGFANEA